jgi:hypothetical protein
MLEEVPVFLCSEAADDAGDPMQKPSVKIIPPLVYLAGIVIGFLASVWMPTKVAPNLLGWTVGGILIFCGAVLTGSAVSKFKDTGTTARPDRAAPVRSSSRVRTRLLAIRCILEWHSSMLVLR